MTSCPGMGQKRNDEIKKRSKTDIDHFGTNKLSLTKSKKNEPF